MKIQSKLQRLNLRRMRVRSKVVGTKERPRLSVNISNKHISAQIIDDQDSKTLVSASTVGKKVQGSMKEKATQIGSEIGTNAKKAKITKVVFDRNGKLYHGRVKALADAARAAGLEF